MVTFAEVLVVTVAEVDMAAVVATEEDLEVAAEEDMAATATVADTVGVEAMMIAVADMMTAEAGTVDMGTTIAEAGTTIAGEDMMIAEVHTTTEEVVVVVALVAMKIGEEVAMMTGAAQAMTAGTMAAVRTMVPSGSRRVTTTRNEGAVVLVTHPRIVPQARQDMNRETKTMQQVRLKDLLQGHLMIMAMVAGAASVAEVRAAMDIKRFDCFCVA